MSTFEDQEVSPDSGKPFELYFFVYGPEATDYYAFTNAVRQIVRPVEGYGNVAFVPAPMLREAYKSDGKVDIRNMNIRTPITSDLARLFLDYPPAQTTIVTIYAGHFDQDEGEYPVVWVGKVLSSSRERNEQVLTCSSTIASMKRVGLRRNYQYACPYVLYGPQCKANREAATYAATVAEVNRNSLGLVAGWAPGIPPEKFLGGMLHWTSEMGKEYRQITRITNGLLTFSGPIRDIDVGDTVYLILGCNHKMDDCRATHNNILNYGGQPWIPLKNPIKYHDFW